MDIKNIISKTIYDAMVGYASSIGVEPLSSDEILALLAVPPDEKMGDYAFPVFSLAKKFRKAPPMIASGIKDLIYLSTPENKIIDKTEVIGGYLNFFMNRSEVSNIVVSNVIDCGENFGKTNDGAGKKIVLDFSSPNIAKPFHIGHLCSTAIGSSLSKIYQFLGYETVNVNHIGDWGTQFGKLIVAYRLWGDDAAIESDPINELLKIYVKFHQEAKEHPEMEDEARHNFKLLEEGDPEVTRLWRYFVDCSIKEFEKMYKWIGIHFDSYAGESFYSDKMGEIVDILNEKNLLVESEGAKVVEFPEEMHIPPCIIIKSDGGTIYATRDLAAALYRKRTYDFDKCIYVVGTPQALHFQQIFGVLNKMGYDWYKDCIHVGFGYVRFPDRVLSTRNGDVVLLEDVLKESIARTKDVITSSAKGLEIENIDEAATKIGIGAVLFAFLKNSRERDIIFKIDEILDFEGESGPYVQYSYARGRSILRKADENGISFDNPDFTKLGTDEEYSLIKEINRFTSIVRDAANKNEPSVVTRYSVDLAQCFNKFYNSCNIMKSDDDLKIARLGLVKATTIVIKEALALIGVDVVEKM